MSMQIMQTLLNIPTVVVRIGDISHEDLMVAQVIRQNVKATYTLPMNTLERAGMILRTCGLKKGQAGVNGQAILACMQRCATKYDSLDEVDAYVMQPLAKRSRRGHTHVAYVVALGAVAEELKAAQEPDEDRLRIGADRMAAATNVLTHCTEESHKHLEMHLVWAGDYSVSVVNDTTLVLR